MLTFFSAEWALLGLAAAAILLAAVALFRRPDHAALLAGQERLEREIRDELARNRGDAGRETGEIRDALATGLEHSRAQMVDHFSVVADQVGAALREQREAVSASLDSFRLQLREVRETLEQRLQSLQADNNAKLEQMRQTVDEKLQGALEKRLGESFALVSERLEKVHQGLGEMQALATGVGDLKKVLTNVKTRGTWGEMQLGGLLEQMLAAEQFVRNAQVRDGSQQRVEYAVRLPEGVLLPIDSKFPQQDWERLQAAAEQGDADAVEAAARQIEASVKASAREICEKYIVPPRTTDFAILYLPTESLYAEVLRRPGLAAELQHRHRVTLAGPTTLAALLTSLQMGFRTLAIQKRSAEVWQVLGAVKTEFGKFGEVIEKVQKKLHEASSTIEQVHTRTSVITKRLKQVEALPAAEGEPILIVQPPERGLAAD